MLGGRAESKAGGAFLASLLVHGAVIAGFASLPALNPGLPRPEPVPMLLALLPAPQPEPQIEAARAPAPATVQEAVQPLPPESVAVPLAESPAPPLPEPVRVAVAPLPLPPVPEVLPHLEPPPPAAKVPPKPRPVVKKAVAPAAAPAAEVSTSTTTAPAPAPAAIAVAAPAAPEVAAVPLITDPRFREPPVKPTYPPRAAALDQQGEALVRVRVGPDGDQEEVLLWRSSGFELLDRAALATVRRWRFEPYRRDGIAFAAWVQVPIRFTLN